MREILSHWPGRIYVIFLAACIAALLLASFAFDSGVLVFGWVPLPFALGVGFVLICLPVTALYVFRHWPYR